MPKPHTPFQWFGQNTVDELRRKIGLLRDATAKAKGVQLKWHDPGPRWPRASPAGAIAASAASSSGCGATAARSRSGASTSTWPAGKTPWPPRACRIDWYVHRHRNEDEMLPWDHISAGLHHDFLWQDWQAALAEHGLEDCRWTPCYDCGVCTGYGIEHVVASPVPPAGGSQGTGQDLSRRPRGAGARWACPGAPRPTGRGGGLSRARAHPVLEAGQGPLHQPPRRRPHVGAGLARGRLPVAYTEGFSPRPKLQLRPGPVQRATSPLAEYLDVDLVGEIDLDSLAGAPPRRSPGSRRSPG